MHNTSNGSLIIRRHLEPPDYLLEWICKRVQCLATYKYEIHHATQDIFYFSGTAQKDTLVNPAPCAISMCKLMTNHARLNGATNIFKVEEFPQVQGKELCPAEYYL